MKSDVLYQACDNLVHIADQHTDEKLSKEHNDLLKEIIKELNHIVY